MGKPFKEIGDLVGLLEEVKIRKEGDSVVIEGLDAARIVLVRIVSTAVELEGADEVVVDTDRLRKVLKKVSGSAVTLAVDDGKLVVRSGREKFRLAGISESAADIPKIDESKLEFSGKFTVVGAEFRKALGKMPGDSVRLALKDGVLVMKSDDGIEEAEVVFSVESGELVSAEGEAEAEYSTDVLKKLVVDGAKAETVSVRFGNDAPIEIRYGLPKAAADVYALLAPRA